MTIKRYKPTTPTLRKRVSIDYKQENIWRGKPVKSCVKINTKTGGRNNKGRISTFNKGGGHKRLYRIIDFKRNLFDQKGYVVRIEYDPNRSANIALISYSDGELSYIISPDGLKIGDVVVSGVKAPINIGKEKMPEIR